MNIQIEDISIYFYGDVTKQKGRIPVLFLHGFTGSGAEWETVVKNIDKNYFPCALDLPGHGKSSIPKDPNSYKIDVICGNIKKAIDSLKFEKMILAGYSMGGRIALSFTHLYPEKIAALILESSTAGIEDEDEREKRIQKDRQLAKFIKENSIQTFINFWMGLQLFETLKGIPPEKWRELYDRKLENDKTALMHTLIQAGTGSMKSLWHELPEMDLPVLLLTGIRDEKFTLLNKKMISLFPNATHRVIKGVGHNLHIENEKVFLKEINRFLSKLPAVA